MRFVFSSADQPQLIEGMCRWAGPRIGASYDPVKTSGISVFCENGCATVLYTDWQPEVDIRMHVAAEGHWLSRTALATFFGFPFQGLGVRRVTAAVAKRNKRARRLDEALQFKYEGNQRKACTNGDDLIWYGMLREECKWLRDEWMPETAQAA